MPAPSTAKAHQETWRNATAGTVFLIRLDHRGEQTINEQVNSGRVIHLTPEERRINMEKAASESQDPFRNGIMTPVRLIDTEEDARELAANPNAMSETDMRALFKTRNPAASAALGAKLIAISNLTSLERLLAMAYEEDTSVKTVERIQARIREVTTLNASPIPSAPRGRDKSGDEAVYGRPVSPR